nr:HAMP domain-containing sensor histidine kinase [uncultured Sellimonas sp.]
MRKFGAKYSIRKQMAIIFAGLLLFLLLFLLAVNGAFAEWYYIANKKSDFMGIYHELYKIEKDDSLGDENEIIKLNHMAEKNNLSILIINGQLEVQYTNVYGPERMMDQMISYVLNKKNGASKVLKMTKDYQISRTRDYRNKNGAEYLEMWAKFPNSEYLLMRSPLESIRTNIEISNQFILYVGILVLFVGIILVWFFSRRISEPLLELACLSKKMAKLDFNVKYTRGGADEIGILGESFNTMSDELEHTISELKTANYELQKDIKKKEQIETMRTEFIGNVSHELKTPIALIQGYAEGLKDGITDDPESMDFYCDVIIDEANKMNRMVKNLLTLNQLELGKDDTQFERIDITSLIKGVVQSLDIIAKQKEADIRMNTDQPVYVWADEFKTEQVVRNYVSNALNHMDEQKLVDIRLEEHDGKIRISVFNTGKPIPEEDLEHIWEKFYKVDKARTREYGGNGIGLSIVKAIMESFHQNYGVKNYENGVKFWFELDKK